MTTAAQGGTPVVHRIDPTKVKLFFYWLLVGIPLGWGVWKVLTQSLVLFGF